MGHRTVTGAILLIAYAHDTPGCIQLNFADDMVSHVAGEDVSEVQSELQWCIDKMSQWAKIWNMVLNAAKMKSVLFGHKNAGLVQLSLNGSRIGQVSELLIIQTPGCNIG